MSSSTDAPTSQAASDLNSQAQQMAFNTVNPITGSAPATASGPDSRTTGGASLAMASGGAPPQPAGPSQMEGPDRRRGIRHPMGPGDDHDITSMAQIDPAEMSVGAAPAPRSAEEASEEGRRQRIEQEFRDLGGPERGTTH